MSEPISGRDVAMLLLIASNLETLSPRTPSATMQRKYKARAVYLKQLAERIAARLGE
jgi:hypothetical protein